MDKLRNLNVAGKITAGFKNFNSQKMTAFFTYLVIVLVIIAVLFGEPTSNVDWLDKNAAS